MNKDDHLYQNEDKIGVPMKCTRKPKTLVNPAGQQTWTDLFIIGLQW